MKTVASRKQISTRKSHQPASRVHSGNGNGSGNGATKPSAPAISPDVAAWLARPKHNLIDGKWVPAVSGKTFDVFNPADGSVIASVADGGSEPSTAPSRRRAALSIPVRGGA